MFVSGLRVVWKITLVAMSSVIESWKPPIWRSALTRSALLVPTSIGVRDPLPARWSSEWKRNCCDSADRTTKPS